MNTEETHQPSRRAVFLFWAFWAAISLILFPVVWPTEDYDPFIEEAIPPPYTNFTVPKGTSLKIEFPPETHRGRLFYVSSGSLPPAEMLSPGFRVTVLHDNPFPENLFLLQRDMGLAFAGIFAGAVVKLILAGLRWRELSLTASLMAMPVSAIVMTVVTIHQPSTPGEWLSYTDLFPMPIVVLLHLFPALVIELITTFFRWSFGKILIRFIHPLDPR